ncbi:Hypothetical protein PENO1_063250 [Penicillium occitanis (nom. inval.)]|nr:Hypothetical protein PENO1_063250 [Penicillium occitanis (nom. inval.)]PCG97800.1 hypothetical protein PENOC_066400 [Penicillium occitanis (nom. inval.)]
MGASCAYQATNTGLGVKSPVGAAADKELSRLWSDFASFMGVNLGTGVDPPIAYRSYMPQLLQFFLTSVVLPSGTRVTDSLAYHLRSQWMHQAMSDPCLFHATLFSASASIDMLRNQPNSMPTLYHQTWVIRLVNERLAHRQPLLTYSTLGAVIPLLYYNMVALDRDSAITHQTGLLKMLLRTPKSFRTEIGPLIGIIKLAMLSFACIYDLPPAWDCLNSESLRPSTLLRNIVSQASLRTGTVVYETGIIESLLDVYEAISSVDHLVYSDHDMTTREVDRILTFSKTNHATIHYENDRHQEPAERINACCQLACQAFWKIVQHGHRFEQIQQRNGISEAQSLLKHIYQTEPLYWVQNAPEIYTWIVFTGAAASITEKDRVAFVSHAGTILTAIDAESLTLTRQGWSYFRLLRNLGGHGKPLSYLEGG